MDMDFQEGLLISIIVFIALSFGWLLIVFIARSFRDIYHAHEERRTMKKLIDDAKRREELDAERGTGIWIMRKFY